MQQVIDLIRLHEEAARAIASPQEAFEWRLERASASSPFTVVAVAEPLDPHVDVDTQVMRVKSEVSSGMRSLMQHDSPPWWMGRDAIDLARSVFGRTANGIAVTEIEFAPTERVAIDRPHASAAIEAIAGLNAISLEDLPEREAFGEIQGQMVAAGRYRNRPAIQIRAELYGFVWCVLSPKVVTRFGTEHQMKEVWEGKALGVQGVLVYGKGGKLSRIEVSDIREVAAAPPLDLASVLDPDFTAGLDPVEYLRRFHEGELA